MHSINTFLLTAILPSAASESNGGFLRHWTPAFGVILLHIIHSSGIPLSPPVHNDPRPPPWADTCLLQAFPMLCAILTALTMNNSNPVLSSLASSFLSLNSPRNEGGEEEGEEELKLKGGGMGIHGHAVICR